jgi:Cu-Zn family superoxide dismutase
MKVLCVSVLFLSLAFAQSESWAHCSFMGTSNDPTIQGTALFHQVGTGPVEVKIQVSGVTIAKGAAHGIHVHSWGDLTGATDGSSVGGHYWTGQDIHGCPSDPLRHNGDMGNWDVDATGNINQNKTLDLLSLTGLTSIIGRAVVIHNLTDNCVNVSSSGSRLAFCVIGIANMANNSAASGVDVVNATCIMRPTNTSTIEQKPLGQVWFIQTGNSVEVRAHITGITGPHGFHLHNYGTIAADGLGSGVHWNPDKNIHGIPNSNIPRHDGDMGNIFYYSNNAAYYTYTNDKLYLSGVESIVGRMVHIHMNFDNCNDPIGKAGDRIGQCVIGIANPATPALVLPDGVPSIQDIHNCISANTMIQTTEAPTDAATDASTNAVMNIIPSFAFAILVAVVLF